MDFAYFNAVLKSVSFPAYDPWYAGGYINYYYFGFVFLGTLVKMLGIVPALAYNIVLPTLFAMIAAGAFSVSWNLYVAWSSKREESERKIGLPAWVVGLSGALVTAVLGNQGTVKMLFEGMQRLAANGEYADQAGFLTKVGWTIAGMIRMFTQGGWPFGTGSWYWEPSRVIPALNEVEPITEFPWFTTIYADLHAHFMALGLVFLGLSWAISVVLGKSWRGARRGQVVWSFLFAGIAVGALRPTNTWDFPTYLALGVVALVYAIMRRKELPDTLQARFGLWGGKIILAAAGVAALVGLSFVLYQPFSNAYSLHTVKSRFGRAPILRWDRISPIGACSSLSSSFGWGGRPASGWRPRRFLRCVIGKIPHGVVGRFVHPAAGDRDPGGWFQGTHPSAGLAAGGVGGGAALPPRGLGKRNAWCSLWWVLLCSSLSWWKWSCFPAILPA